MLNKSDPCYSYTEVINESSSSIRISTKQWVSLINKSIIESFCFSASLYPIQHQFKPSMTLSLVFSQVILSLPFLRIPFRLQAKRITWLVSWKILYFHLPNMAIPSKLIMFDRLYKILFHFHDFTYS